MGTLGLMVVTWQLVQEFQAGRNSTVELMPVFLVRSLAIVSGVFMLQGKQWARWLCIAWFAYHIVLSFGHSTFELLVHCGFAAVVSYILLRPPATIYFRAARARGSTTNTTS